jgi:hypothetical protein
MMKQTVAEQRRKLMHYLTGEEIKMAAYSSKNEEIVIPRSY